MNNMLGRTSRLTVFAAIGWFGVVNPAWSGTTLDAVKSRDHLICGVSKGLQGFSANIAGKGWAGFDVDFCRAVAAAVLGDKNKVKFVGLSAKERFDALSDGRIDLLSRNTTWTMSRDIVRSLEFVGITYFDGQGFMVRRSAGLSSAMQLAAATVCVLDGTTSVTNAETFFKAHKLEAKLARKSNRDDALKAYADAQCDAYTADRSALAAQRAGLADAEEHMLLPEVISKEPLGPVVRQDDIEWRQLVQWVLFVLINAEEKDWSAKAAAASGSKALLNVPKPVTEKLALSESWPRDVITAVGNYGEIFERNLGASSPLKIPRGVNALWTRGGILYAPPIR